MSEKHIGKALHQQMSESDWKRFHPMSDEDIDTSDIPELKIDAYLLRLNKWKESRYQESLKNPSPQREKIKRIKQQKQDSLRRS